MRFDARELAVSLMPWNRAEAPGPDCGACTPATTRTTTDDDEEPADRCHRAGQLGLLRVQLGAALSQPGAR